MDSWECIFELCKEVTLLNCLNWLVKALTDVQPKTIKECFAVAGLAGQSLSGSVDCSDDDDEGDPDGEIPLEVLIREYACTAENFGNLDKHFDSSEYTSNEGKTTW